MLDRSKLIVSLLVAVVLLLAVNFMVYLAGPSALAPRPAMADIVSGKNYFSTHSPDGQTIYLWYYDYRGTPSEKQAFVEYMGRISTGEKFQRP